MDTSAGIILKEGRLAIRRLGLTGKKERARIGISSGEIAARKGVSKDVINKWICAAGQLKKNDPALYQSALERLLAGGPSPDLPASSRLRELHEHVLGLHGEARKAAVHNVLTTPARRSDRAAGNKLRYPADPIGAQALRAADQYAEMLPDAVEALNALGRATRQGVVPVSDALDRLKTLSAAGDAIVKVASEIRASIEETSRPRRDEPESGRQNCVDSKMSTTMLTFDGPPSGPTPSATEADRATVPPETALDGAMSTTATSPNGRAPQSEATSVKETEAPGRIDEFNLVSSMRVAETILAGRSASDVLRETAATMPWARLMRIIGGSNSADEAQSDGEPSAGEAEELNGDGSLASMPAMNATRTLTPHGGPQVDDNKQPGMLVMRDRTAQVSRVDVDTFRDVAQLLRTIDEYMDLSAAARLVREAAETQPRRGSVRRPDDGPHTRLHGGEASAVLSRVPESPPPAVPRLESFFGTPFSDAISDPRKREFEMHRALRVLAYGPMMTGYDSARARLRALGMSDGEIEAREAEAIAISEREIARATARLRG